jgi:S-formylglutathione hydrolase FrmB
MFFLHRIAMRSLESQDTFDSWLRILNASVALLSRALVRIEDGDSFSDNFFWRSASSTSATSSTSSTSSSSVSLALITWQPRYALLTRSGRLLLYASAETAARGRRRVLQASDAMQALDTLADGTSETMRDVSSSAISLASFSYRLSVISP